MRKNLLLHLRDIERKIRNSNHLILSIDLDNSWWQVGLDNSATYKIKNDMKNLANKSFVTLVVTSTKSSNMLFKEIGLSELVYVGNYGLDILYRGNQIVEHNSLEDSEIIADFYWELVNLIPRFKGLSLINKYYSVQIRLCKSTDSFDDIFMASLRSILRKYSNILMTQSCTTIEFTCIKFVQKASIQSRIKKFIGKSNTVDLNIGNHLVNNVKKGNQAGAVTISIGEIEQPFSDYHLDDMGDLWLFLNWLIEADCINNFDSAFSRIHLN